MVENTFFMKMVILRLMQKWILTDTLQLDESDYSSVLIYDTES